MNIHGSLSLGAEYSKRDLASLLDEKNLLNVREGVYSCKNSNSYLLFVDLEKTGKEERFQFNDFFDGEYFHWDSQPRQHIETPKLKSIISGEIEVFLFVRVFPKFRSKTLPFIYCGRAVYAAYDPKTTKPVHITFENIDYDDHTDNQSLQDIYLWSPESSGVTSNYTVSARGIESRKRVNARKKPLNTERESVVKSRNGQDYFRAKLLDRFAGKCAVTGCSKQEILIASHIVPWSEDEEVRLDEDNGILLSPNYDALFDKHLISFEDDGGLIKSLAISEADLTALGIHPMLKCKIHEGMLPYLKRHRDALQNKHG
jgi:hypothetical protein